MTRRLEVMTFNLRHGWADDGPHSWENRRNSVAATLGRHQADVICFQEVNHFQLDFLASHLSGHTLLGDVADQGEFWEHRPVFLRQGIEAAEVETFNLSETPEEPSQSWGSQFIRQTTRVLARADGWEFAVYNTHLDFEEPIQLRQAAVIWEWVRKHDLGRPVILTGDFNSQAQGGVHSFLTGESRFQGLKPDFEDAMLKPREFTYHRFTGQPAVGYIDWILYRHLKLAEPAQVIYESHGNLYPSDHFPVKAAFSN